jgi:hypothetical protein
MSPVKVERNTLTVCWECWDDPGDYPSNAGSGPLSSYEYPAGLDGEIVLTLDPAEVEAYLDEPGDFIGNIPGDLAELPSGIRKCKLTGRLDGATLTLTDEDGEIEGDNREDDYDD